MRPVMAVVTIYVSIMRKFGQPVTVVPKYTVGPPFIVLFQRVPFPVHVQRITVLLNGSEQWLQRNNMYGLETCTVYDYVEVDQFFW